MRGKESKLELREGSNTVVLTPEAGNRRHFSYFLPTAPILVNMKLLHHLRSDLLMPPKCC